MVWTINRREEMLEAVRWGVKAVLTDLTKEFLALKTEIEADYGKVASASRFFLWTRLDYYTLFATMQWTSYHTYLEKAGGKMVDWKVFDGVMSPAPIGGTAVTVN